MACAACGFVSPAGFKFCGECGARLEPVAAELAGPSEERRHLTVMFCDVVGSTTLSERLDPEELRDIMRAYQAECAAVIERTGGHIAQYLGDGLLVYYGFPEAHEDDARRAVSAGLDIVAAVADLHARPGLRLHAPLQVRVGIHTGLVVTGEVGSGSHKVHLAMGETPNVAARLQSLAGANEVVMSRATQDLVAGFFECEERGPADLRGLSRPIEVFRALRPTGARSRFELEVHAGLGPFVGRDEELAQLRAAFAAAAAGEGRALLITGEAGIGKSRLLEALKGGVAEAPHLWLLAACSAFEQNVAFAAGRALVRATLAAWGGDAAGGDETADLEALADHCGLARAETAALLGHLLGRTPTAAPAPQLPPALLKRQAIERAGDVLVGLARTRPVVAVVEDVQWADPSTREMLEHLAPRVSGAPLLLLVTSRAEDATPPAVRERAQVVRMARLDAAQTRTLVTRLAGGRRLPPEIMVHILGRTDGVPLFVHELTRSVLESGVVRDVEGTPRMELAIPATLHDSLAARLDRLGRGKEVAQIASVLAAEIRADLLQAVSGLPPTVLAGELAKLVRAEILTAEGAGAAAVYAFRHALLQEAAYQSLLRSRRAQLHAQVATAMAERFPELARQRPELMGHHLAMAQAPSRAIPYYLAAGDRARAAFGNAEAIAHYREGLQLAREALRLGEGGAEVSDAIAALEERLGDVLHLTGARDEARTMFRSALAQVERDPLREARLHRRIGELFQTEHRRDEALKAFALAASALGPTPASDEPQWWREWLSVALGRMWVHYWQAELPELQAIADDVRPRILAHGTAAQRSGFFMILLTLGLRRDRYVPSADTLAVMEALSRSSDELDDLTELSKARFNVAFARLCAGDLPQARRLLDDTLAITRKTGEALMHTVASAYATLHGRRAGSVAAVREAAGDALALATRHRMLEYVGLVRANLAWAAWRDGDHDGALDDARAAVSHWSEVKASYPFQWTGRLPLALVLGARGDLDGAIEALRPCRDPSQQALPADVDAAVDDLVRAAPAARGACLQSIDASARRHGLL